MPSTPLLCMARYARSRAVGVERAVDLYCHYEKGHDTDPLSVLSLHSWQTIKDADEAAAAPVEVPPVPPPAPRSTLDSQVEDFIEGIEVGDFDPYIEWILAAGHDRKRALRGARGFRRRDRT